MTAEVMIAGVTTVGSLDICLETAPMDGQIGEGAVGVEVVVEAEDLVTTVESLATCLENAQKQDVVAEAAVEAVGAAIGERSYPCVFIVC